MHMLPARPTMMSTILRLSGTEVLWYGTPLCDQTTKTQPVKRHDEQNESARRSQLENQKFPFFAHLAPFFFFFFFFFWTGRRK